MEEILLRLSEAGIELLPALELTTHFALTRDGFVSLVERRGDSFGGIGAPGMLTDRGMAHVLWRGSEAFFVAKGFERRAGADEIQSLRRFAADLKKSLSA